MERSELNAIRSVVENILRTLVEKNRNILSDEFEESLEYIGKYIDLKVHKYKTGSKCWTWEVPSKWRVKDGYIKNGDTKLVSFKDCPLHIMSYSVPVRRKMKGEELLKHIYVHKIIPTAIPYEFSYYVPKWGFCLTQDQKKQIKPEEDYEVFIDSEFIEDYLSIGECILKGESSEHIFFLSHLDHPYQVNDGLIGCAVNAALAVLLKKQKLYYNYHFLFLPETIGSIVYLSNNEDLIPDIKYAVFNEMVGLNNPLTFNLTSKGSEFINSYIRYLIFSKQGFVDAYPFLTGPSNDEKVFNSPGVNIPSIAVLRVNQSKILQEKKDAEEKGINYYASAFPEYHSHLDNINIVNFEKVLETIDVLYDLCQIIENDFIPVRKFKGPVFLSKYNLWPDWRENKKKNEIILNLIYKQYFEGDMTVFQIAEELGLSFEEAVDILNRFAENGLIEKKRIPIRFDR